MVAVEFGQGLVAVGRRTAIGQHRGITKQLGTIVNRSIGIEVTHQQAIAWRDPTGLHRLTAGQQIKLHAIGHGQRADAIAVKV